MARQVTERSDGARLALPGPSWMDGESRGGRSCKKGNEILRFRKKPRPGGPFGVVPAFPGPVFIRSGAGARSAAPTDPPQGRPARGPPAFSLLMEDVSRKNNAIAHTITINYINLIKCLTDNNRPP